MHTFDALKKEIEGHQYSNLYSETGRLQCPHPDHGAFPLPSCWKASVTRFLKENPEPEESKSVDEFAQKMIARMEPGAEPVLTKYVFVAEAIDDNGDRCSYNAATDNMAAWDAMGLLKFGLAIEEAKMVTNRLRDEGVIE